MKRIGIIGGGIIGLSSAYYLAQSGHDVTILDSGDFTTGCSFGNAGMIVPSHFIPLAAPGMITRGIRWMFDPASPFYIKPRLNTDLLKWGYHFYRNSTKAHVDRSIPALRDISLFSKSLYQQLSRELPSDFGFQERGLLMLFQTSKAEREEAETVRLAGIHGIEAHMLSGEEAQRLEPKVRLSVRGGVYFPGDAHLTPQLLIPLLVTSLKAKGVKFESHVKVNGFIVRGKEVKEVLSDLANFSFDAVVVAGGSWSGEICSTLGFSLPIQAGKGYSFTLEDVANNLTMPSIFCEARVAVTPMGNSLRFGGTLEIGKKDGVDMKRVAGIVEAIGRHYPELKVTVPAKEKVWYGLRPCSPDGLPYIGRTQKVTNVVVATGHAMMGLSLGPATGKLVAEIINEQRPDIDLAPFAPERFT